MIPESFIQDLLARVDIADVVGRYVQLRKGGANLLGLCPFHNEKSPSFTVSPTKQFYHCFGCGAHGSAITFLMEHTGANFPEAVRTLAGSVGLNVPEEQRNPRQQAEEAKRKEVVSRYTQVLDAAQAHYLKQLRASTAAIRYLKGRGLTGEIAAQFGLGWSGTDRQGLGQVFERYDDPVLVEAGLVIDSDDGRRYDRFRERVMFPIRNQKGTLVGFGGRIIGKGEPKYLNSPETPVFSKGQELYGLWESRQAVRKEGHVLVVEGYMDVVGLAQQGIANAVATLGTATTPDHIKKLLRTSDRVVFSFDGDKAGRKAAWRALTACLPVLRDDISIRFLFLPSEHDPDSYVRELGAEAFRASVSEASALSRFLLDELGARHRMDEAEGRAACLHEAKPLLAAMPECALRVQIEREIARAVQLTPEEMAHLIAQAPAQPYGQPTSGPKLDAGAKFPANDRSRRPGPGQAGAGASDNTAASAAGGIAGESGAPTDAGNASHPMDDIPLEAYSAGEFTDQDVEYLISGYELDHSGIPAGDIDPSQGYAGAPNGEGQYGGAQGGQYGNGQGGQYGGGQGGQYGGGQYGGGRPGGAGGYGGRPGQGKGQGGGFRKNDRGGSQGSWGKGKGNWRDRDQGVIEPPRPVPTLPKRLLFLLLLHPELVDGMGDQQLEVLDSGPHLGLVRELIVLAQTSGARHVGALLEAAEPDSDLSGLLRMMRASVLAGEDLPDPQAEWDDALHRIEFDAIRVEMQNLASSGLADEEGRKRYQDLSRRLQVLKGAGIR